MSVHQAIKGKWTKDGRKWYAKVNYKDINGKVKWKYSQLFLLKEQAREAENELKEKIKKNLHLDANLDFDISKMTFKELRSKHKEWNSARVKETTLENYEGKIAYLTYFDDVIVIRLDFYTFTRWKQYMMEQKLSNTTRNDILKYFKSILNFGINYLDMPIINFYRKITTFSDLTEITKEMDFYTFEEFNLFISFANSLKDRCLFETLYYCGLRCGEIRGLQWKHIDFENREIRIKQQVVNLIGKGWQITSPKTKSSIRPIPMAENLLNDLKMLYKESQKCYGFNEDFFVFGDIIPIGDTQIAYRKNKICKSAELKVIRLHDFRHSCASLLINNGANVTIVAKYLGHSKIEETLNTYSHMFDSTLDSIVNLINKLNKEK